MSKRFTTNEKWRDRWFASLPLEFKLLWLFLCDTCDAAGVWPINLNDARSCIFEPNHDTRILQGFQLADIERHFFNPEHPRLIAISPEKWWIPAFIYFQYSKLSVDCKPHKYIWESIRRHNLLPRIQEHTPWVLPDRLPGNLSGRVSSTLQEKDKEKEKDMDKEKDKEKEKDKKPRAQEILTLEERQALLHPGSANLPICESPSSSIPSTKSIPSTSSIPQPETSNLKLETPLSFPTERPKHTLNPSATSDADTPQQPASPSPTSASPSPADLPQSAPAGDTPPSSSVSSVCSVVEKSSPSSRRSKRTHPDAADIALDYDAKIYRGPGRMPTDIDDSQTCGRAQANISKHLAKLDDDDKPVHTPADFFSAIDNYALTRSKQRNPALPYKCSNFFGVINADTAPFHAFLPDVYSAPVNKRAKPAEPPAPAPIPPLEPLYQIEKDHFWYGLEHNLDREKIDTLAEMITPIGTTVEHLENGTTIRIIYLEATNLFLISKARAILESIPESEFPFDGFRIISKKDIPS